MGNRISILVVSESIERLQVAAMLASVGAVSGHDVLVFLPMNALRQFRKAGAEAPPSGGIGGMWRIMADPANQQSLQYLVNVGKELREHPPA